MKFKSQVQINSKKSTKYSFSLTKLHNLARWYFLNTIVRNETFFVIFHLPDYKAISNTMQYQKSH